MKCFAFIVYIPTILTLIETPKNLYKVTMKKVEKRYAKVRIYVIIDTKLILLKCAKGE